MTTPNLQLPEVPQAIEDAADEINAGNLRLDAVVQLAVIDKDLTAPPDGAVQGDRYIVPVGVTSGAWANRGRSVAMLTPEGWIFMAPRPGWKAMVLDENKTYQYLGTTWTPDESTPVPPGVAIMARGASWVRKTGALAVPLNNPTVRIPAAGTIIRATILTEGGPGSCVIDIRKDVLANYPPLAGDSICSASKPSISSGHTQVDEVLSGWNTAVAAGDILRFVLESSSTFSSIYFNLDIEPA